MGGNDEIPEIKVPVTCVKPFGPYSILYSVAEPFSVLDNVAEETEGTAASKLGLGFEGGVDETIVGESKQNPNSNHYLPGHHHRKYDIKT